MMKANLKKMVLAAAMAAFMVYAPAMAEEADEIIEESFEAVEETPAETAAPTVEIQVLGLETVAAAEVPAEVAQVAEAAETEKNAVVEVEAVETEAAETEAVETEAATFYFENDEVIIRAEAVAELPENVEMQVRKLEEGSAEYEAAKQAVAANRGTDESAEYKFYEVKFTADGVELAEGSVNVQVEFKTVQKDSEAEAQEVVKIDESGVNNVTAETEEGNNMSSVDFAM